MASDSLFSRSNKEEGGSDDPAEGVRIIKPDEAAEAVERGEAVKRKGDDQPKYGDRPPSPPKDTRPALRFPLPDAAAASSVRPRVAPVDHTAAAADPAGWTPAAPEPESGTSPSPPEPQQEPEREPVRPEAAEPGQEHAEREASPAPPSPRHEPDRPVIVAREDLGLPVDEPIIRVEPATGETELLHWTEPATGEVPKVVLGDLEDEADPDEQARWSSFAASGAPRWRDEHDSWEHSDPTADLTDPAVGLGALDTSERPSEEAYLGFDDLEVPSAGPAESPREAEPIRIQSGRSKPAPPEQAARPASPEPGPRRSRSDRGSGGSGGPGDSGGEQPHSPSRDVPLAVFVGIAIAAVAVIAFSVGAWAAMILVEVVVVLAAVELFAAVRRGGFRPATLLALAAVAGMPLAAYWRGEGAIPLVLFLLLVFTVLWFLLGVGGNARPVVNMGVTVLGVVYAGMLGAFAALILAIPDEGVSILLVAIVAAVFYDVGGFFTGQKLGRTPLSAVSPNKTVEGLAGGAAISLVAVFVVAVLFGFGPFSAGEAFLFWLVTATAAFFGDLAESLIKRDLGLKDMGSLIPGHGGVLDRFDGLLFVLPAAYYFVRVFDLVPGL
jgi:phosphatidate cytidylyltransferase